MKNISVISETVKITSEDEPNLGEVIFREVELHNGQPVFLIFASSNSNSENISEKSAQSFETIVNTLKSNISLGNLESLKTAFSEGLSILQPESAALVTVFDQTIYALTQNLGQVYLKRHSTFAPIVHNPPLPEQESEAQKRVIRSASGTWEENDIIVLSSNYHPVLKNALKSINYKEPGSIENTLRQEVDLEILSKTTIGICRIITLPGSKKTERLTYDNLESVDQNVLNPKPQEELESDSEDPLLTSAQKSQLRSRIKDHNLIDRFKDPRNTKKIYGLLTLTLIIAVMIRLFLAFAGITQESKNLESERLLLQAQEEFTLAQPLKTSNPPLARKNLVAAQSKINNILALSPNNESAKILLTKIQQSIEETLNVKDTLISDFLKLDLIKTGATGHSLDLDGRLLNILDSQNGTLYQVNIDRKSTEIVGGGENVKNAQFVAGSLGRTFAYKDALGIVKSTAGDTKTETVIKASDQSWNGIGSIASFGGNVYTLDNGNNQVWKYTPTENAFSPKTNYIKDAVSRDISDGIDMSIDGSVWILTKSENIYNFLPDSGTSFPTSGLDKKIGDNAKIYSDAESTDLVYVLDAQNSRVIAFSKTGGYRLQYQDPQIASAIDIAVSEKDQTIFLLTPNSILSLKL